MKKHPRFGSTVRLSDGNLCVLLGLIGVGLEESAKHFSGDDLRQLVELHRVFVRKLGTVDYDYEIRDGQVVNVRNPRQIFARVGRRNFSRLTLALSHG